MARVFLAIKFKEEDKQMGELVLTVRSDIFKANFGESATDVIFADEAAFSSLIESNHEFISRELAEPDPSYKQIISYCLISSGEYVFMTRRTKKQSEARLHNKHSVGIGGHINSLDAMEEGVLLAGMKRELSEEVYISAPYSYSFFGIINDNSSEVNSVHAGACYVIEVENRAVSVRETEKMEGIWVKKSELSEYFDTLEGWSKILINSYMKSIEK